MIVEGNEIKETIKCWCGGIAYFHHISIIQRKDGKKTIWYKCLSRHKVYEEVNDPNKRIIKTEKKTKTKSKSKPGPNKDTKADTN